VSRFAVRPASLLVLVLLTGLGVAGFKVTRDTARHQEQRLLEERAGEVATLLTSAMDNIGSTLRLLGEAYAARHTAGTTFRATARSLLKANVTGIGVAEPVAGGDIVVRAGLGKTPAVGARLTGDRGELIRRALRTPGLVSALARDAATQRSTLMLAVAHQAHTVIWQDSALDPSRPVARTPGSPYYELDVVLYRSPEAQRDQLLLTTTIAGDLSPSRPLNRRTLVVGTERWLMLTSPVRPLGGSTASLVPWTILAAAVATAVLMAVVIEGFLRRHRYALALVEERTTALRQTVSELETARATADAANRSKSAFLSRMSHELRTPLNAVLGFAQLLDLGELTDGQQESVDLIIKGGNHLLELINDVLDISRIETGDLPLSPEAVELNGLLADVMDLVRPLAAQRRVHLVGDRHHSCDEYVFADRQRLQQILLNLLSNAIKYNREAGTVAIACERSSATQLRIKVSDTGPGIPAEQLGLLFVPFERLGADRSDVEGVGIGLALSRELARAMGGSLDVETAIGQGSTFWLELALVEGPVERYERLNGNPAPTPARPTPGVEVRHTVLYIEDNLANLKLVQNLLGHRPTIKIIPAMQGRLGLELAREHHPVLILLDLHLPDIGGDQVLQELRDDPTTASTPVVILSADATTGQVQRLLSAGACAYLTKPFNVRELLRILDSVLTD
jgi:signal transduction histidine kinase/CheY-like chemotaxis protein